MPKNKKPGRKPAYDEKYNNIVYIACKEGGFTDIKLARLLGVCKQTINNWKKQHPAFYEAMQKGKDEFDTLNVENDLLKNARGFKYTETTKEPALVQIKDEDGKTIGVEEKLVITKTVQKTVTPSTTAQIYWLKNRNQKRWRDRKEIGFDGDVVVKMNKKRFDGESED